jgi:hypothetical protein
MLKKHSFLIFVILLISTISYAHEPIYGLGPETLPKHLNAIEFGTLVRQGQLEYTIGYGYGITQNLTVRLDATTSRNNATYGIQETTIKTKFALWRDFSPGVLKRLTLIAAIKLPTANIPSAPNNVTAYTIGLANGYESRRWYYFSDVSYTYLQAKWGTQVGGRLKYNLVGGIRPIKSDYLKPDLVVLVELNGEFIGKSRLNNVKIQSSGGNTLAVAPGFLFSYRNIMLKGGVQFNIANTKNINQPKTNGLATLEYHF